MQLAQGRGPALVWGAVIFCSGGRAIPDVGAPPNFDKVVHAVI
jgi:hypothetical protein